MTTYRLGINTCFAVKRWPQPERWATLVRDELGLDLVQHSLDLVDLDSYAWLERLGRRAPVVQLQHADGQADHHWPFTPETNATGIISAERVPAALDASGVTDVALALEVIAAFEQDDDQALADLVRSARYWRDALARHAR